jgi:PTH1 family peptidyl-tRNA hydrolase
MPEGAPLKIIIGLGNPGKKYERTRHNAGFLALDALAADEHAVIAQEKHHALITRMRITDTDTVLAKPQTYMNDSGRSVAAILRDSYVAAADLIVLHDELDLPLGAVRVKIGGGHGGHNGLRSIIEYLGSPDFVRVRIGIGRPKPGLDPADYVLSPFIDEEKKLLPDVLARAGDAVRAIIQEGPSRAMNLFNQK